MIFFFFLFFLRAGHKLCLLVYLMWCTCVVLVTFWWWIISYCKVILDVSVSKLQLFRTRYNNSSENSCQLIYTKVFILWSDFNFLWSNNTIRVSVCTTEMCSLQLLSFSIYNVLVLNSITFHSINLFAALLRCSKTFSLLKANFFSKTES